jgi:hypothetical protein
MMIFVLPPQDASPTDAGAALAALWEKIREELDPDESEALGEVHVGTPSGDEAPWAHTNANEERVNLTLELKPEQLELNLVGWNAAQADLLKGWLQSVPGEDAINALPDYEVVAFARQAYKKTPTSQPYWLLETVEVLGTCPASDYNTNWSANHGISLAGRPGVKAAYHVRRSWPRAEAEKFGDDLPGVVAVEVRRLLPLLRAIWQS